jgi:hypothetical protein
MTWALTWAGISPVTVPFSDACTYEPATTPPEAVQFLLAVDSVLEAPVAQTGGLQQQKQTASIEQLDRAAPASPGAWPSR